MTQVFLSYVTENRDKVARLASALLARGVDVWFDRMKLLPGDAWKEKIRLGISQADYVIVCFSDEYCHRLKSYMNEELVLIIEELRLRQHGHPWLIPVTLSGRLPDIPIGAGRRVSDLQAVDLSLEHWSTSTDQILAVIAATDPDVRYDIVKEYFYEHPKDSPSARPKYLSLPRESELRSYLLKIQRSEQLKLSRRIGRSWPVLKSWEVDCLAALSYHGYIYRPLDVYRQGCRLESIFEAMFGKPKEYYPLSDLFYIIGRECYDQDSDWEYRLYDIAREPLRNILRRRGIKPKRIYTS